MRYLRQAAVLAAICVAVCCQSPVVRANDSSSELSQRLKPVAWWKFDADNGHVLLDETEQYVGLSQGGVRLANRGPIQGAGSGVLAFDGHRGCAVVRHRNELLLDQGSIACWVRADDVARAQGILSKDASGFGDGGHLTISLDQGQVTVRLQSVSDSYEVRAEASKNRWTHVAFTFGSEGMQLYVDGSLVDTAAYQGGIGESSGGVEIMSRWSSVLPP